MWRLLREYPANIQRKSHQTLPNVLQAVSLIPKLFAKYFGFKCQGPRVVTSRWNIEHF